MGKWGAWTLGDAVAFIAIFLALRFAMFWVLTQVFLGVIPSGNRCPICDSETLPIERNGWWRLTGSHYRRSWCLDCGWEGVLRREDLPVFGFNQEAARTAKNGSHLKI